MATRKERRLAAILAAGTVVLASLPTAGFAVGALDGGASLVVDRGFAALTPASIDPRLAKLVSKQDGTSARLIRFTPAGVADRANRSITVAVRIDEGSARAVSVRSAIEAAKEQVATESGVRIAPTRYNLGLSRGYQSFAKKTTSPISPTLSDARIPDLAAFRPSPGAKEEESRFVARIAPVDDGTLAAARVIDSRDQALDVAGSYRLTRNLDVTAGVRYSQENNRAGALVDSAKQDNQAVYVGTQFRF